MRQPLTYQTLPCSCWVTSVTNGLLFLYGDKNKIPGIVLRLLNSVLTDDGVLGNGTKKADWEIVLSAVADKCQLVIENYHGEAAADALLEVNFKSSVVICDVGSGAHSIILNHCDGDWYYGFDPDWDQVNKGKKTVTKEFEIFPDTPARLKGLEGQINFKVHRKHLLGKRAIKGMGFAMGAVSARNLTVVARERRA